MTKYAQENIRKAFMSIFFCRLFAVGYRKKETIILKTVAFICIKLRLLFRFKIIPPEKERRKNNLNANVLNHHIAMIHDY